MSGKTGKILVAGSMNMDMVVNTASLPVPGETVPGEKFFMNAGGKGANQAVAAARLGGEVLFLATTGNDPFGKQMLSHLKKERININYVRTIPGKATGVAMITVNSRGENMIVVVPGANASLSPADVNDILHELDDISIILMQLETPLKTVEYLASLGKLKSKTVILNPAPAMSLPAGLWQDISVLTPNRQEAALLSGIPVRDIDSAVRAARFLLMKGPQAVVITLGNQGALLCNARETEHIPVPQVPVVDTTAAGDTFNGALAAALAEGKPLKEAVSFANNAAALTVQKPGAQPSIPKRKDIYNMQE